MILSTYPGGLGATNGAWLTIIAALAADGETAALAATLTPYVSADPELAVQYVEIPLSDADAATVIAVAEPI